MVIKQQLEDSEEERVMISNSDNIKFTSGNNTNEVFNELFESLRSKYQGNLEILMKGSHFIFDSVQLMYAKFHKVNFKHGSSYICSPNLIKNIKASINTKIKMINFQYAATVTLNCKEIKSNPEMFQILNRSEINIIG